MNYKLYLESCLYFNTNSLSRTLNKIAEEEFMITGLSPSHAIVLLIVIGQPGISQNELGTLMNFAPSTITRFIDKLESRRLIRRETEGKSSKVYPTDIGKRQEKTLNKAWDNLYNRYCTVLKQNFADKLTKNIHTAKRSFEKS